MDLTETIARAREMLGRDEAKPAQQALLQAWNRGERSSALIMELALCHLILADAAGARKFLTMAEARGGDESRVYCYQGVLALLEDDHQDALRCFERSLTADPTNAEAYKWRGICCLELQDTARALADMDRACAQLKQDAPLFVQRGHVHARIGDLHRALADFERAAALAPYTPEPHCAAGRLLTSMERYDEAREHFDLAVEFDFTYSNAWTGLAEVFAHRREPSEVLRCLATAVAVQPTDDDARLALVSTLIELGEYQTAAFQLSQATEAAPPLQVKTLQALIAFHEQDLDIATGQLDEVLSRDPSSGLAHYYRGLIEAAPGGDRRLAHRHLEQARAIGLQHAGPELALAELHVEEGDAQGAMDYLVAAFERDPQLKERVMRSEALGHLLSADNAFRGVLETQLATTAAKRLR